MVDLSMEHQLCIHSYHIRNTLSFLRFPWLEANIENADISRVAVSRFFAFFCEYAKAASYQYGCKVVHAASQVSCSSQSPQRIRRRGYSAIQPSSFSSCYPRCFKNDYRKFHAEVSHVVYFGNLFQWQLLCRAIPKLDNDSFNHRPIHNFAHANQILVLSCVPKLLHTQDTHSTTHLHPLEVTVLFPFHT